MTAPPAQDPETEAFSAVLPFIRSSRRTGWILMAASVAAIVVVSAWLFSLGEDGFSWGIAVLFVGLMMVPFAIADNVRRKQEKQVLPLIARAFGLTYTKSPPDIFYSLPEVFIPRGGRRSVDDQMAGEVAGRRFEFTEVKTETGGKNSRTLFRGVVVSIANARKLPQFVIASTKETKGFLFFRGNVHVEGMEYHEGVTGADGTYYGLWSHGGQDVGQLAGLQAFMRRMSEIGPQVLGSGMLYSVACDGRSIHVALTHGQDLFRVGGIFANEARVMADIRGAAEQLGHPIRLVSEVLRAEEALMAAQAKDKT